MGLCRHLNVTHIFHSLEWHYCCWAWNNMLKHNGYYLKIKLYIVISHLFKNSENSLRLRGLRSQILAKRLDWLQIFFHKYGLFLSCVQPYGKTCILFSKRIFPSTEHIVIKKLSYENFLKRSQFINLDFFQLLFTYCFLACNIIQETGKTPHQNIKEKWKEMFSGQNSFFSHVSTS